MKELKLIVKKYNNKDLKSNKQDYFLDGYDPLVTIGVKKEGSGDWVAIPVSMIDELIIKLMEIKQ